MVGARNKVQFREAVEHFVMKVGPEGSVAEHVEQTTTWRWSEEKKEIIRRPVRKQPRREGSRGHSELNSKFQHAFCLN